jgi:hypothetical protein
MKKDKKISLVAGKLEGKFDGGSFCKSSFKNFGNQNFDTIRHPLLN